MATALRQDYRSPWGGHFDKQSLALIAIEDFYRKALGSFKTRRNRKDWVSADCPFHPSESHRSFSVNLNSGAFHCWGCDARGGDILDFVRRRDGSDFKSAARQLGCWSDSTWAGRAAIAQVWKKADQRRAEAQAKIESEKRERLALRDQLHASSGLYDKLASRLSELRRGATPAYQDEEQRSWAVLPVALTDVRLSAKMYCKAAGLEVG
jgi:hypothetical protein